MHIILINSNCWLLIYISSRYKFRELFSEDTFYDTLEDVVNDYRQQTGQTLTSDAS